MRKAILRRFLLVLLAGLLVCGGISSLLINDRIVRMKQETMLDELKLMDSAMDYSGNLQQQLQNQSRLIMKGQDARMTVVDFKGKVLADTGLETMNGVENHLTREEVQEAIQTGEGFAKRTSKSLGKTMLYASLNSEQGDYVLRLSIPYSGMGTYVSLLLPAVLFGIAAALVVSFILAGRFARSISQPLSEIAGKIAGIQEYASPDLPRYRYEELNAIVDATEKLSEKIARTMKKLRLERNKIQFILENMEEGLILLDEEETVLTINRSAKEFLDCTREPRGSNLVHYTIQMDLLKGVTKALEEGASARFDFVTHDNRVVCAHVSRTSAGVLHAKRCGVIVLLLDVTSDRQSQKMRQDFFSNASHELKTPVTSIQGFAELLEAGVAKDEETRRDFIRRIQKEARNMDHLVSDILMISQLESDAPQERSEVRLDQTAREAMDALLPLMEQLGVTGKTDLQPAAVDANPRQMYELISNLVSNAVKYNRPGGTVSLRVKAQGEEVLLTVEDTGIGIPLESQGRIFERFYRVDKGRSKRMGGTGLGLAIVKHLVQFYHGSIHLQSKAEQGTKIEVRLPRMTEHS